MNPSEEAAKRQQRMSGQIGGLAYERLQLSRAVESSQKRIAEIDEAVGVLESRMSEADQARRDFDTYLAIQEGAVTADQLKDAIETGERLETPPGAMLPVSPENGGP